MVSKIFISFLNLLIFTIFINLKPCHSIKILIGNDDCWGTANIRALYYAAKRAGHQVLIAAPANQQSGTDGIRHPSTNLVKTSTFGLLPPGSPAEGHDPEDDHIWYINSTPASSIEYGLNVLCPKYFKSDPDLVITGTNQGLNVGLSYLGSGTFGAAKYAVKEKNIPAIAFSAQNHLERKYTELQQGDQNDQANVYASMAMKLIDELIKNKENANQPNDQKSLLPLGTLLNVNFPDQIKFGCQTSNSTWTLTRLLANFHKSPDTCTSCDQSSNDQCKLPTESSIFRSSDHYHCTNSISLAVPHFHPDASIEQQKSIDEKLNNLLSCLSPPLAPSSQHLQFQY